jgi:putative tricarboxylic transport membrane protein
MARSEQWQRLLETRGWSDYYLPASEFTTFLDAEEARIGQVLRRLGLAR